MRRHIFWGVATLVGAYALAVGYQLWSIHADLSRAQTDVRDLSLASIERSGGLREATDPVLRAVRDAEATADSPLLGALGDVPVIGDQVDGLRAITDQLRAVADTGDAALGGVERALERTGAPGGKVALVSAAIEAVDIVAATVDATPEVDTRGLVGPLRAAARDLDHRLEDAALDLVELRDHLDTAEDLLRGPTRVLLLAANNAELRGGMGMHLSAGVVTVEDGDFTTSRFVATSALKQVTRGRAERPDDLAALYPEIWGIGREWRTTSTTPNFPVVGSIFADLASRSPVGAVDVVLSVDAVALQPLLRSTGPVVVDGDQITADNVVDVLLRDNYLRLGEVSETAERRDLQGRVAGEIMDAVGTRDVDAIELAGNLVQAAEGRHLMAWSGDDEVQDLWSSMGLTGALGPRSFLVAFQNASASKRDYYIRPTVSVVPAGTGDEGGRRFSIRATLHNPVVEPTAPYVETLSQHVPQDVHRAYVTFTLPRGTTDVEVESGDFSRRGTDGPTEVVTVWMFVPKGETRSVTVEATFAPGVGHVELVPSARVVPQTYRFGPVTVNDDAPRTVPLPVVDRLRAQQPKLVEAAGFTLIFLSLVLLATRARRLAVADPDVAAARADMRLAAALTMLAALLLAANALI